MKAFPYAVAIVFSFALFAGSVPQALAESEPLSYTVSGKVESDQGEPIEGAHVRGWTEGAGDARASYPNSGFATTDAEGRYSMQLPGGKGAISVYYEKWRQGASKDIFVEGNTTGIDFVVPTPPPKTAIVTGRILDERGEPIAGAFVRLDYACCYAYAAETAVATQEGEAEPSSDGASEPAPDARMSPAIMPMPPCCYEHVEPVTTGDDGVYRFETYGGPRQVIAHAKGYAQSTATIEAKANETVTKDVRLEKVPEANAVVSGRVVDAETGLPVRGAQVSVNNMEWSRYGHAETREDGSFEIRTLPGWSQVSVHVYSRVHYDEKPRVEETVAESSLFAPSASYYAYTRSLELEEGANEVEVKLDPKPEPSVVLLGYVVDPETKTGIPEANVNVWNQDTGDWGTATTDETGSYKILVRPGHYTANVWAQGYLSAAESFVIREGESTKRADFRMPEGETKDAPCYDDECGYGHAYPATMRSDMAMPMLASAEPEAVKSHEGATMTAAGGGDAGAPSMMVGVAEAEPGRTNAVAYQGSGGGLPPYSEAEAAAAATDEQKTVPGVGILAMLGLAGLAALAMRRR